MLDKAMSLLRVQDYNQNASDISFYFFFQKRLFFFLDLSRFLVHLNVIRSLCALFQCGYPRIILVALEGVENILRTGSRLAQNSGINPFSQRVEECQGFIRVCECAKIMIDFKFCVV